MKRRRVDLGLSQRKAAIYADVSPTTWGSLETHHNPIDDLTRPKFCRALSWTADSIDRVLSGLDPVEDDTREEPTLESLTEAVWTLRSAVTDLMERMEALERPRRK